MEIPMEFKKASCAISIIHGKHLGCSSDSCQAANQPKSANGPPKHTGKEILDFIDNGWSLDKVVTRSQKGCLVGRRGGFPTISKELSSPFSQDPDPMDEEERELKEIERQKFERRQQERKHEN